MQSWYAAGVTFPSASKIFYAGYFPRNPNGDLRIFGVYTCDRGSFENESKTILELCRADCVPPFSKCGINRLDLITLIRSVTNSYF